MKQIKPILSGLPEMLLPWFTENCRDLPWRKDRDPYHIWLSEIMLQQTRVEAVRGYYLRFLENIPTIEALANADDALLHKLWEGLGYYSRVRNLKRAAQTIMTEYNGTFPREYSKVLSLPGIGSYTAGAVCSIAFGQKTPAVDGNVLRVVSRLTDDPTPVDLPEMKKKVTELLSVVYPDEAGDFTQAIMELGATVCGPNHKPNCLECPCREICMAYLRGHTDMLPVRLPKKQRKQEDMTVFILQCGDRFALQKREDSGLLAGLWEFPHFAGQMNAEQAVNFAQEHGWQPSDICRVDEKIHIFTHIQWNMRGIYLRVGSQYSGFTWLTEQQIVEEIPLPTAFRKFWDERFVFNGVI